MVGITPLGPPQQPGGRRGVLDDARLRRAPPWGYGVRRWASDRVRFKLVSSGGLAASLVVGASWGPAARTRENREKTSLARASG